MNRTTALLPLVQKDEAGAVVQLQIALDRPTFDTDGQALVTPAVATADEFGERWLGLFEQPCGRR